jgi:hypothetical protein
MYKLKGASIGIVASKTRQLTHQFYPHTVEEKNKIVAEKTAEHVANRQST